MAYKITYLPILYLGTTHAWWIVPELQLSTIQNEFSQRRRFGRSLTIYNCGLLFWTTKNYPWTNKNKRPVGDEGMHNYSIYIYVPCREKQFAENRICFTFKLIQTSFIDKTAS